MAFALVGSVGAASVGASGAAVTPAWGAGANRTPGNLLLLFVSSTGTNAVAGTPSGWFTTGSSRGTNCMAVVFYKIATGADAAPTVAAITGSTLAAHLEEWSGVESPFPDENHAAATGVTSPITATASAADSQPAELVVMAGADFRSVARASADTWTSNHGTPTLRASNNAVSSVSHYSHATLVTNSNSGANTVTMTLSITTSITGLAVAASSFRLAVPRTLTVPLLDASPTLYAPTLDAVAAAPPQSLSTDGLLDSVPALSAPTVAAGPVSLTVPLVGAGPSLSAPSLAVGPVALTLATLTSPAALSAPALSVAVAVPLLDAGPALSAPAVQPDQFVSTAVVDGSPATYAPSLLPQAAGGVLPLLDAGPSLTSPAILPGPLGTTVPLLDAASAVYAPGISLGPVTVTAPLLDGAPALLAPAVQPARFLVPPLLDAGPSLPAPSLLPQAIGGTLPLLDSGPSLASPALGGKNALTVGSVNAGPAVYAPSVLQSQSVALPLVGGSALYQPGLSTGPLPLALGLLDSGPSVHAPSLGAAALEVLAPLVDSGPAAYAPSGRTQYGMALPLLDSGIRINPLLFPGAPSDGGLAPLLTPTNEIGLPVLGGGDYGDMARATGPIGYWRFGDSSSPAVDQINGNDGTASGSVTFGQPGAVPGDTAVAFGPGNITVPEAASLHTGDTMSVAFWVQRTRSGVGNEYVAVKIGFGEWFVGFTAGDYPAFGVNGQPDGFRTLTPVTDTDKHFIAFTKDGADQLAYFDGVEGTFSDNVLTVSHAFAGDLWFGVSSLVGLLDEFLLYDRVLSPEEVAGLAAAPGSPAVLYAPDLAVGAAAVGLPTIDGGTALYSPEPVTTGLEVAVEVGPPAVAAELAVDPSVLTVGVAIGAPSVAAVLSTPVQRPVRPPGGPSGTVRALPIGPEPVPFLELEVALVIGPPRVEARLEVTVEEPPEAPVEAPPGRLSFNRQVLLSEVFGRR